VAEADLIQGLDTSALAAGDMPLGHAGKTLPRLVGLTAYIRIWKSKVSGRPL
jgi:hypothetical protein